MKLPNLLMLIKQNLPLPRNLAHGKLLTVFLKRVNLLYLLYSMAQRYCLLHTVKKNCLLKTFFRYLFACFSSRTNLKLHNISVTLKLIKKVTYNLDLSKASNPNCIPVVILKICEPELSYILAEIFNLCWKESSFPDCWKVSLVVPILKNVGKTCMAKNYCSVSFLSVVNKSLKYSEIIGLLIT